MVVTQLEARVPTDRWAELTKAYAEATQTLEAGIAQTFLLHGMSDPELWRILTVWRSREDLAAMRGSGQTPRGVLIFRQAGAEPALQVFDVAAQAASR